jgi:TolA-binding protein
MNDEARILFEGVVPRARACGRVVAVSVCLLLAGTSMAAAGEKGHKEPKRRPIRAGQWAWMLPAERYKTLTQFERAQYDKAAAFFKDGDYRASASEFEKFKVQFQDSATTGTIAYIAFMHGYALYLAKDRNAAIKVFTEVLDYFKTETDDAAAALYFKGMAQIDNGDVRKGLQSMQQMAEDEEFRHHPLAAGALRRLADNHYKSKQPDLAVKYWKQVCEDFAKANPDEAKEARQAVTGVYLQKGDYAGYEAWLTNDENRTNAPHRRWMALQAHESAGGVFDLNNYGQLKKEEQQKDARAFHVWFKAQKPSFDQGHLWTYYDKCINFLTHRLWDKKERDETFAETVAYVKGVREKAKSEQEINDAHHKFAWLSDRMCEMGRFTDAELCAACITDPPYATFKLCEVLERQNKWKEAAAKLMDVEKSENRHWADRAKEERARIYKDATHEYDKAVKLYQEIDKPPGTLWHIQDCYKRWGKVKEAITQLTEIENSFPDQASAAAWRKAQYLDEAGDKTAAIAGCRRILKVYKASREASGAHQLLEKYGIKTGGGVFEGQE